MTDSFWPRCLPRRPVMVILRGMSAPRTVELCERAAGFGVELIEVTVQDEAG
jgi:2-keto-3-deoxy-6-phosphogluconate aldolase